MSEKKASREKRESSGDSPKQRGAAAIFEALRSEIAFGQLKPRERLIEHELCERFGTSNHNVRQAFELLDRVGLIERRTNRGVEVKLLSPGELDDLYEVRVMLQREGARKIDMSRSQELAALLKDINSRYSEALSQNRINDAVRLNDAFHMATFDYCTNADLANLQRNYWLKASAVTSRAMGNRSISELSVNEHALIIAAIKSKDAEQLAEIAVRHMLPAIDLYRRLFGLVPLEAV